MKISPKSKLYACIFILLIILSFSFPKTTFAVWWNPISWFQNWFKSSPVKIKTPSNNQSKFIAPSNTPTNTPTPTFIHTPYPLPSPASNTTLCNGVFYSACPSGLDFVCPANGEKAYCVTPQKSTPQNTGGQNTQFQEMLNLMQQRQAEYDTISKQLKVLSKVEYNIPITNDEYNILTPEQQQAVNNKNVFSERLKLSDELQGYSLVPPGYGVHCKSQTNSSGTTTYTNCY